MDLSGPTNHQGFLEERYLLNITDDFTRIIFVYPLQYKSLAANQIKQFLLNFKNQLKRSAAALRSDQGGEFSSSDFISFCRSEGINLQFTAAGSHQSNGIAVRLNRTLFGRVQAMLLTAKLSEKFWAMAAAFAACLKNRFPKSASEKRFPHELWYGQKPDLSHLRTRGCVVYVHPTYETDKLKPRAKKALMVGVEWRVTLTNGRYGKSTLNDVSSQHNVVLMRPLQVENGCIQIPT